MQIAERDECCEVLRADNAECRKRRAKSAECEEVESL